MASSELVQLVFIFTWAMVGLFVAIVTPEGAITICISGSIVV